MKGKVERGTAQSPPVVEKIEQYFTGYKYHGPLHSGCFYIQTGNLKGCCTGRLVSWADIVFQT
jgi:hypothetical protein